MPCNCDHMSAHPYEVVASRLVCLLEEVTEGKPIEPNHWRGYHPKVYNQRISKQESDALAQTLCDTLSQKESVSDYSLELQVWWRDHQQHDKERLEREQSLIKTAEEKRKAISKLTPYERKLLGLEE